jgi:biopolymer transport protein ExbD
VYLEIQADGKTCMVRGAAVDCGKVLLHLRQVLKLAPGSEVRFRADRAAPYGAVKGVMDSAQKSEYTTAVAYLTPPNSERAP